MAKTKPSPTASLSDLEALRQRRAQLLAEKETMSDAFITLDEAQRRIDLLLARLSEEPPIDVSCLVAPDGRVGDFAFPWDVRADRIIGWLLREPLRAKLIEAVERELQGRSGLPEKERRAKLAQLAEQLRVLEAEEERMICELEAAGADAWRRGDVDLTLVLAINRDAFTFDRRKARRLMGLRDAITATVRALTDQRVELVDERRKAEQVLRDLERQRTTGRLAPDDYAAGVQEQEQRLRGLNEELAEIEQRLTSLAPKRDALVGLGNRVEQFARDLARQREAWLACRASAETRATAKPEPVRRSAPARVAGHVVGFHEDPSL